MAFRVFCFSLFLIRIRLFIGDSFRSKISILIGFILFWFIIVYCFFKVFDRRIKIGIDGVEFFGVKK